MGGDETFRICQGRHAQMSRDMLRQGPPGGQQFVMLSLSGSDDCSWSASAGLSASVIQPIKENVCVEMCFCLGVGLLTILPLPKKKHILREYFQAESRKYE